MMDRYVLRKEEPDDYGVLERRFRDLLPPQAVAFQTPSKPAYSYLKRLSW